VRPARARQLTAVRDSRRVRVNEPERESASTLGAHDVRIAEPDMPVPGTKYLVFSQNGSRFSHRLAHEAREHFGSHVEIEEPIHAAPSEGLLHVRMQSHGVAARFTIATRAASGDDVLRARHAEQNGGAGGMSALAARCGVVWMIEPEDGTVEFRLFELCALLALIGLGPILPPDDATLFGFAGAARRAADLRRGAGITTERDR